MKPARRCLAILLVCVLGGVARAQPQTQALPVDLRPEDSGETATLAYYNREIVILRARVLGRGPADRVAAAARALDDLVANGVTAPVASRPVTGGLLITVGGRVVFGLADPDVDVLSGDTLGTAAERTIARLRMALAEAAEAHTPAALLRSTAVAVVALVAGLVAVWAIARLRRPVAGRVVAVAENTVARLPIPGKEVLRSSPMPEIERGLVSAVALAVEVVILSVTIGFILRRFPFTRPWGESVNAFLLSTAERFAVAMLAAVPGLVTIALIVLITRFAARLIALWFAAVEQGRVVPRWIHRDTAAPTRRLLTTLLWVFACAVAYPFLPGSQTDAFKGVSVFVGLLVTLGSSGLVNQIMSGFMITYSRALSPGDFVRIGDVEGVVTHLGVLSTKVRTLRFEEVTLPNAVVVAQTITDYSRPTGGAGVLTPTSVTIGYDTPWRQVHALLLGAAARTSGVLREPAPCVMQAGLEDFYVKYTLFVVLERQDMRLVTLDELHGHIQDLFNEYGVQIMSPNYVLDPARPKIVAKADWFSAPASPDGRS